MVGHTAKSSMCKNKVQGLESDDGEAEADETDDMLELGLLEDAGSGEMYLNNINDSLRIKLPIQGKSVLMEIDSGACRTVIHLDDYREMFHNIKLSSVNFKLRVVTGENVCIVGQFNANVKYQGKDYYLPIIVLKSKTKFIPLLGRNWLNILNPSWKNFVDTNVIVKSESLNIVSFNELTNINTKSFKRSNNENILLSKSSIKNVESQSDCKSKIKEYIAEIKTKFANVFTEKQNSCIKDFKVNIQLKSGVKPIFHRAYEMPFSLKPKVESELSNMVQSGVLTKVSHSNWASPIVVVPKKNSNEIRVCVDFKRTVNKVIESDHCVLPLPFDIFACLSSNSYFTVIDLKGAYQQLKISEYSKELFTINTHLGLFRYNRLTYGISSAPGIFQSIMETILSGLPNTKCYLDDILIFGKTLDECHHTVIKVISRLERYNVRANESKCRFYKQSIEFLGHIIDAECIFKLRPRTRFDLIKPTSMNKYDIASNITRDTKTYSVGDLVFVKNVQTKLWEKGKIVKVSSPVTYLVQVNDNVKFIHANDMRLNPAPIEDFCDNQDNDKPGSDGSNVNCEPDCVISNPNVTQPISDHNVSIDPNITNTSSNVEKEPEVYAEPVEVRQSKNNKPVTFSSTAFSTPTTLKTTRSGRIVKPPVRLDL